MTDFLEGSLFLVYLAIAVFFARFWRRSRDRLFLFFALAFGVLSATRLALSLMDLPHEAEFGIRMLRLVAYILILWAIVDRNRAGRLDA